MPRGVKKDVYAKLADAAVAYADADAQFRSGGTLREAKVFKNRLGKLIEAVDLAEQDLASSAEEPVQEEAAG